MGCTSSKSAPSSPRVSRDNKRNGTSNRRSRSKTPDQQRGRPRSNSRSKVEDVLNGSQHGGTQGRTKRQQLAWHRDDMALTDVYNVIEIVGQGSMGEVTIVEKKQHSIHKVTHTAVKSGIIASSSAENLLALAEREKPPSKRTLRRYACKTVNTIRMRDKEIHEYVNEIDILRDLDHPNIIQLFEVFRKRRKLWIVTELCTGGDLTARMDNMSEADVSTVVEQILRAVVYMHRRHVCHRDLKLENILYSDKSDNAQIKLIDFGLSNKFTKGEKMIKAVGTIYAAAPEVLLGEGYTEKADIWSIGVVCFVLLSQNYPFLREYEEFEDEEKRNKLANAEFEFGPEWQERNISIYAKEFIGKCLKKEPTERWTAKEVLEFTHSTWIPHTESLDAIAEEESDSDQIEESAHSSRSESSATRTKRESVSSVRKRTRMDSSMVHGMNQFALYGELKKTILMTMAYTMDKSSLHELRDLFVALDERGDGIITMVDLKKALQTMHSDKRFDEAAIEKLFYGIDQDNSGQIHYNEFLAAVIESQGLITMEHLADTFERLDSNGKGYISKEDLKNLLGSDYNEETVDRMIDEADFKKNGCVDYDEFLSLMFKDPTTGMQVIGNTSLTEDMDMVAQLGFIGPAGSLSQEEDLS